MNDHSLKTEIIWPWLAQLKRREPAWWLLEPDTIDMPESERAELGVSYLRAHYRLDRSIVYLAGSLIHGRALGDDSFSYFRNWLIWCGPAIVETAIKNPDGLHDRLVAEDIDSSFPICENLGTLGVWAASSRHVPAGPLQEEECGQPTEALLREKLPKLWAQLGHAFEFVRPSELPEFSEAHIPGIGLLRVGDKVFHKKGYGEGEILRLVGDDGRLAFIRFAHEEMPFWLDPEFIERVNG